MNSVTVVDARMGRGKSSAAIRYMNRHKATKKFLYITPYLNEVNRICEQCDFDQSDSDTMSQVHRTQDAHEARKEYRRHPFALLSDG